MANGTYAPDPVFTAWDSNGDPISGAKLFTYTSGTSTKATTYSDIGMTTPNANPVVCDSAGRATVVLVPGESYKFVLGSASEQDPPQSPIWTRDNIQAVPTGSLSADVDVAVTGGETITAGQVCYISDGSGGTTAGRAYKADADQTYSSTAARAIGFANAGMTVGSAGTLRIAGRVTGLSGLVAGTGYYVSTTGGALTSTAPTNARAVAVADSTTSAIVGAWAGTVEASSTVPGVVSIGTQTLAGAKTFSDVVSFNSHPKFEPGTSTGTYAPMSGVIYADTGPRSATNVSTEQDLSSFSLPANVLDTNSKAIRVTAWGSAANTAGTKILRVYFGATSLAGTLATHTASTGTERWYLQATVMRRDATNQRGICLVRLDENGLNTQDRLNQTSPAETLANAITVKTTCQNAGGAAADVLQEGFLIEILG